VGHFYVPLGVGSHLKSWGIAEDKITEMDWWDEADIDGIRIATTPAQHFSGRGLTDRNKTLWASWVITGQRANIFFSGDSGYGKHFQQIGDRYGPFDFTMMECGQYNTKWHAIHSMPEESVQGHRDLRGTMMMPIHWGGFTLAPHRWTEPVERVRAAAEQYGVSLALPMIGQRFIPSREKPDWGYSIGRKSDGGNKGAQADIEQ
jgi:L-ascorbate metabolism protein UlaG (beta-lactamase superfamily)